MWRSSAILRIVESRCRSIRICTEIIDVQVFVDTHETAVSILRGIEWTVAISANRTTSIRKFASRVLLVRFVEGIGVVICCLLSATTNSRVVPGIVVNYIATAWANRSEIADIQSLIVILHVSTTHIAVNWLFASMVSAAMMEPCLVELVGSNLTKGILIFSSTSAKVATVALVDWIARSSRGSLLSQLSFCNCLGYRIIIVVTSTVVTCSWEHAIVSLHSSLGVEELCSHHHLLLLGGIRIWSFSLIDQVEQMSLISRSILMADTASSSNSVMTNAGCSSAKSGWTSSVSLMLSHHGHIILISLSRSEILHRLAVSSITLSEFGHEVAIEHCLSHLYLLILVTHLVWTIATWAKTTNSCLIEHLILIILCIYIWQHVMDSRIISWLQHNSCLCCVHLIYWKWSVTTDHIATSSLFPHAVSHEESLIWLLWSEPIVRRLIIKLV